MDLKKVFVVDTSLLLHTPEAIPSLKDNVVVIPFPVLQELDHHKDKGGNGTATAARQVIRLLDDYRKRGSLLEGVPTPGGGFLLVDTRPYIPNGAGAHLLKMENADDFIIGVALRWKYRRSLTKDAKNRGSKKEQGQKMRPFLPNLGPLGETVLITKDINLRIKAAAFDLPAEDYKKDRLVATPDQLYSGIARIRVKDVDGFKEVSTRLFGEQNCASRLTAADAARFANIPELFPNQCCIFELDDEREKKHVLALYKASSEYGAYFSPVRKPSEERGKEIRPRNIEQAFAYALLMDPEIQIISLSGIAGGGKTLMALLAGLNQTVPKAGKGIYEQILVYRANSEIGTPLGFLKGSLVDKWGPWAQPILDSLELLSTGKELERFETKPSGDSHAPYNLEEMIDGKNKKIQIQPINFVRGRSLHFKFVVVDETQNFAAPDIKKVITRIGKGSKIVLTGDIDQIDNLYLDQVSNGLSHVTECMKGQPIFGHITFTRSERSPLAEIAAKLL